MNLDLDALLDHVMLDWHIELLEHHLPSLIEAERARLWADVDKSDEQAIHYAEQAELQLDNGATWLLTGSALIAVWAYYETWVDRCGDHIRAAKKLTLRRQDLRGSFVEAAKRYFADVLQCELHPRGIDWGRLGMIADLRHAVAHVNGNLDRLRPKARAAILKWSRAQPGLAVDGGERLIVSIAFVRDAFKFLDGLLDDLRQRAQVEATRIM